MDLGFIILQTLGRTPPSQFESSQRTRTLDLRRDRKGLEPSTSGVTGRHSNQPNYRTGDGMCLAPPCGSEPRAFPLGGGRSIGDRPFTLSTLSGEPRRRRGGAAPRGANQRGRRPRRGERSVPPLINRQRAIASLTERGVYADRVNQFEVALPGFPQNSAGARARFVFKSVFNSVFRRFSDSLEPPLLLALKRLENF